MRFAHFYRRPPPPPPPERPPPPPPEDPLPPPLEPLPPLEDALSRLEATSVALLPCFTAPLTSSKSAIATTPLGDSRGQSFHDRHLPGKGPVYPDPHGHGKILAIWRHQKSFPD